MGITPWISKNNHECLVGETKKNISLLVVTPKLCNKEQFLLHNILSFLGLQEDKLLHLETNDLKKLKERQAAFILFFGFNLESTPKKIRSESLNDLLNNPLGKKKLFHDLLILKEQLSAL